jgi:hypothetical protein
MLSKELIKKRISLNYIDCYYKWYKNNTTGFKFLNHTNCQGKS